MLLNNGREFIWGIYGGQRRRLYKKECIRCEAVFYRKLNGSRPEYCTKKCSEIAFITRVDLKCAQCGAPFQRKRSHLQHSKTGYRFCSRRCKDTAQQVGGIKAIQPGHYKLGKYGYRQKAMRNLPHVCVACGYKENADMLDADHIDSNRNNNRLDNLQLLCVWCHALKTRGVGWHTWKGPAETRLLHPNPPKRSDAGTPPVGYWVS